MTSRRDPEDEATGDVGHVSDVERLRAVEARCRMLEERVAALEAERRTLRERLEALLGVLDTVGGR